MLIGLILGLILGILITLFITYKPFRDLITGTIKSFFKMLLEKPSNKPKHRKKRIVKGVK